MCTRDLWFSVPKFPSHFGCSAHKNHLGGFFFLTWSYLLFSRGTVTLYYTSFDGCTTWYFWYWQWNLPSFSLSYLVTQRDMRHTHTHVRTYICTQTLRTIISHMECLPLVCGTCRCSSVSHESSYWQTATFNAVSLLKTSTAFFLSIHIMLLSD